MSIAKAHTATFIYFNKDSKVRNYVYSTLLSSSKASRTACALNAGSSAVTVSLQFLEVQVTQMAYTTGHGSP